MNGSDALPNVSRETTERLEHLQSMLGRWTKKINLVASSTVNDAWNRHIVDSVQVYDLARPQVGMWADLGTGGGFPGLVISIMAKELAPSLDVILVESDQRKCAFLRSVVRELDLDATVKNSRIEKLDPLHADFVSARALAPLKTLLGYADRHLSPDGTAVFLKGAAWKKELSEAQESWNFTCEPSKSVTDPNAVVLSIGALAHV